MTVGVRFTKESAKRIATVVRATEASPVNLAPFRRRSHQIAEAASVMDYSDFAFGFSVSGAVVTLIAGEVHHGKRNIYDVSATTKTLTADHQYLWIEYKMTDKTVAWAEPSTARVKSDDITYRVLFYQFRLIASVGSIERIYHIGNVEIPGAYG